MKERVVRIGKETIVIALMEGVGTWGSSVTDPYSLVVVNNIFKIHLVAFEGRPLFFSLSESPNVYMPFDLGEKAI